MKQDEKIKLIFFLFLKMELFLQKYCVGCFLRSDLQQNTTGLTKLEHSSANIHFLTPIFMS